MPNVSFKGKFDVQMVLNDEKVKAEMESRSKTTISVVTSQFHRLVNPYVRMDTGMMLHSSFSASNYAKGEIVWNTPYAVLAYYNETSNVNTQHHPNACARWAEVAWAKYEKVLQALAVRTMGGN